jgi:1-acyl-sn-glycerol-3-phosphate acyltransferase
MSVLRLAFGLAAAALFLLVCGPPRRLAQWRQWRIGRRTPARFNRLLCAALGVQARVHGRPEGARRLIVANHVSWLDIPVLGSIEPMMFLAKKEIGASALGGRLARLQGVIFIDRRRLRGIPEVNAQIVEAMNSGNPVVLFAEATTGDGNRLLRFRSSHFEAARRAALSARGGDAVIQPVFLDYSRMAGMPLGRRERPLVAWYGDMTFSPLLAAPHGRGRPLRRLFQRADSRVARIRPQGDRPSGRNAGARARRPRPRGEVGYSRRARIVVERGKRGRRPRIAHIDFVKGREDRPPDERRQAAPTRVHQVVRLPDERLRFAAHGRRGGPGGLRGDGRHRGRRSHRRQHLPYSRARRRKDLLRTRQDSRTERRSRQRRT